ncbi:LIC_10190 family membrane protein [Flavobacterium ustbae]|uniref:LIC_10190 family membrane protein n=1 Tax=Flavobacterium ustbae TaxID=2488790 RepID=UPI000F7B8A71|nr:hypothetical protein [Flavobacterium ustbae]
MLTITISWIYILFTTLNLGVGFDKIMNLKNKNFIIACILGLFTTTLIASVWAIFGRINFEFHIAYAVLNILLIFKFRSSIVDLYKSFLLDLKNLSGNLKIFLAINAVLIVSQCASAPFVIDNESYYIQTIKWLNEYGFVKGIVNLHLFNGQTSGWHITQSVFNFSFIYKNFNDLSGFCLLLGNIFAIQKLNDFYKNRRINDLIIGLLPLFNVFLFQFISAPSPDVPVYVFSFIFFYYFLENFKNINSEIFNLLLTLVLFLLYIKNTTLTFAIFPLILFVLYFKSVSGKLLKPILLSLLVLSLFFIKNIIICGTPLFPSKMFFYLTTDYAVPNVIQNFYYDNLKYYGYSVSQKQYSVMSEFDLFLRWITLPKLNGVFNKLSVLLILITPLFIYKFKNEKALWAIYIGMVLQLFLLLITSPQYRFSINFILFFSLFCFVCFVQNKKIINLLFSLSIISIAVILFLPLNLSSLANNKTMRKISTFSFQNSIFPYQNSKSNTAFETVQLGNLKYNSPQKKDFLWASGNGDLPCVNKEQIDSFKENFHYIPQMRTNNLKDGFYAKRITTNE